MVFGSGRNSLKTGVRVVGFFLLTPLRGQAELDRSE
jgi:hypothetical protein